MKQLCAHMQQPPGLLASNHKTIKAPVPVTFRSMGKVLCALFTGIA